MRALKRLKASAPSFFAVLKGILNQVKSKPFFVVSR